MTDNPMHNLADAAYYAALAISVLFFPVQFVLAVYFAISVVTHLAKAVTSYLAPLIKGRAY